MNDTQLSSFQDWFKQHIQTFHETDPLHQRSLDMKEEHTFRVCAAIDHIASALGLSANDIRIANVTALFHDLGRFPQYQKYRTFRDPDSENHAKLSLWELNRHRVLHSLHVNERQCISRAIIYHNRLRLPDTLDPQTLLHSRLIRDADKVDILRVMIEQFQTEESLRNPVISLGLGTETAVRDEIYDRLFEGKAMGYVTLKSTDELKVLQMSWVFDINFLPTLALLREQNAFGRLAATMPDTPMRQKALNFINESMDRRLQNG
jgi:HD superfamily phosphodiesterase